jgi:hypothetical protein
MAQITIQPPANDYELPSTVTSSVTELGTSFKMFCQNVNANFNELYNNVGNMGSQHVALIPPSTDNGLPNIHDLTAELGDNFKSAIDKINAMFAEIYSLSPGSTSAQVTLRGPANAYYLPNTRDFTKERGDSFRIVITQINAMFSECYNRGSGAGGFDADDVFRTAIILDTVPATVDYFPEVDVFYSSTRS